MAHYECTFICSPEMMPEKMDEILERVNKIVETAGGKIIVTQQLGRKRLAYPIRKFKEGTYVYLELDGEGPMIAGIESYFKVTDQVIRYLTVQARKKKVQPRPAAAAPEAAAQPAPQAAAQEVKPNESDKSSTAGAE